MISRFQKKSIQLLMIVAVFLTIVVNMLAVVLPINDKTTQELSDNLPNLFVPAGLTFSIWSVIYILLIIFAWYQARDIHKKDMVEMPFLQKIWHVFFVASLANVSWILLWHYEYVEVSLIAMIVLFISLLIIYLSLGIGKTTVSRKEYWCVHVPFSVYFGWITVATIANVTAVLVHIGWDGFGITQELWMILILIVIFLITILMVITRRDIAYALVIVWALLGIVLKRLGTDPVYGVQLTITYTAALLMILLLIGVLGIIMLPFFLKKSTHRS